MGIDDQAFSKTPGVSAERSSVTAAEEQESCSIGRYNKKPVQI